MLPHQPQPTSAAAHTGYKNTKNDPAMLGLGGKARNTKFQSTDSVQKKWISHFHLM
jgi:hypothetical protein